MATGDVSNSGDIAATAVGSASVTVRGIDASSGGTVANSGNITVSGSGPTGNVYGIFMGNTGTLAQTGMIRAPGDNAYQVFVQTGTTTLSGSYNMTLEGTPSKGSIYVDNAGTWTSITPR